eukprot:gnl/MRDRNA2_/MRDRNA2_113372_c0_seq1.p1 gnl/MRDRNA2_/MRDRNA2_113372_c0~~gnl/MRDRNA2_/MRDRNA2_113372_c0_seq1.p1  ORF type:complete len:778 (+),score=133.31 gnl/MRDRNA2_/MRDRNA2_113372_c0_seq1:66-2399(+)
MHIAVLGGTISGTIAARQLGKNGVRVDLFRNLNDPKRNISNAHPLCEYQTATFVLRDDAPPEFAEEVKDWLHRGLVEEVPDFWFGHINKQGNAKKVHTPGKRYRPKGGFFALLDSMMAYLPDHVDVKTEQLVKMVRRSGKWLLRDRHGADFGCYDAVIFAFDAVPRAARKASEKQLLETALPHSQTVIASAARAQMCSCMATVLHFDPPLDVQYDSILFNDVPELQFVARNPKEHQQHRGIREKYDTWTLVATPAWSMKQRPDGPSGGKWDKQKVGRDMEDAFRRAMRSNGSNAGRARQIVPTFHWEGCSYITEVKKGEPCAFDADVGLGWCGDMFGGQGPVGAFVSGKAAGSVIAAFVAGSPKSVLPLESHWGLREAREGDEDTMSVVGSVTGRHEPSDGLDHTWDTTVRLANGEDVQKADSYKRFRKHGPLGEERYQHKEGPWSAPSTRKDGPGTGTEAIPKLKRQQIDEGILKITGLPADAQSDLLQAVFPPGAQGVFGGLYDARRGTIEVGRDKDWSVTAGSEVTWSQLGLHGQHALQLEELRSSIVENILHAIKEASPEVLRDFSPDSVRVSFETMHGRTIRSGQTLCGWSRDGDRADNSDTSPKVCVIGGSAKIWRGYKYRKEDRESLDVDLNPGDILVLYGPARTWVSAVNGFEEGKQGKAPFDFAHIWFQDHRRLHELRPDVHKSIHHPASPAVSNYDYKWMQFPYTVLDKRSPDGEVVMEVSHRTSAKRARVQEFDPPARVVTMEGKSRGRRWQSKVDEENYEKIAGA